MMDITRKQERILSQRQKESVTVPQASYYGWIFFAGKVLWMDILEGGIMRRG